MRAGSAGSKLGVNTHDFFKGGLFLGGSSFSVFGVFLWISVSRTRRRFEMLLRRLCFAKIPRGAREQSAPGAG